MFTHGHVTPPVSGDLQERSCCSGLLTLTLFTPSLQPPMWIPTIVFFVFLTSWRVRKLKPGYDDDEDGDRMFDLKASARDGGRDVMRRCNNRVSVEHNWPVVCLNGILAQGDVKRFILTNLCVCSEDTHTHTHSSRTSQQQCCGGGDRDTSVHRREKLHRNTLTAEKGATPHNATQRFAAFSQACWWAEPRQRRCESSWERRCTAANRSPARSPCRTPSPFLASQGVFLFFFFAFLSQTGAPCGGRSCS